MPPLSSPSPAFAALTPRALLLAVLAMGVVVLLSNVLVQFPINDWLTWGAFSYPLAFLVSNLINRRFGPRAARRVAWCGFALAVLLSIWIATPRIAAASCLAFIAAQLLDIAVFDRLRRGRWWRARSWPPPAARRWTRRSSGRSPSPGRRCRGSAGPPATWR